MSLTLTCVPRNAAVQADVPVDHFAAGVAAPDGWQWVAEWRWRADPADDWSAPTIQIMTPPDFATTFTPPADGWVQLISYSTRNGLTSWQGYEWEGEYVGGEVVNPARYVDEDGNPYVDENADIYYDA